jgi:O-antigen ligase
MLRPPFVDETVCRALLFALPPALYLAPLAAAWLLPLAAAAIAWLAYEERVLDLCGALVRGWFLLPLVLVLAASCFWAPDRQASALLAVRLTCLLAAGTVLAGTLGRLARPILLSLLVALGSGMVVAGVAVAVDLVAGTPWVKLLHGAGGVPEGDFYSRGAVFQGLLATPLAIALWRAGEQRLAAGQWMASAASVLLGVQLAAKLALVCGLVAGVAVLGLPLLRWVVPAAIVIGSIGLPWALPVDLTAQQGCWLIQHKPSGMHRLLIWNWVDARIRERPALGWGLDAARRMPGGQERVDLRRCDDPPAVRPRLSSEILPLHPHNAALQIWLELGGLGIAAAVFGVVAASVTRMRALAGPEAAPLAAVLAAGAAAAMLSFGIWQEWWVAVLCIGLAIGNAGSAIGTLAAQDPAA